MKNEFPTLDFENNLWEQGISHIAGVDEAGRGPLAGPVVAAAVVFDKSSEIISESKIPSKFLHENEKDCSMK